MPSQHHNGGAWIRSEKRIAIYLRDGFRCCYCARDLSRAPASTVTLDHLHPRCRGGGNDQRNLVTACKPCNSARGAASWRDYAALHGTTAHILRTTRRKLNMALARAMRIGAAPGASSWPAEPSELAAERSRCPDASAERGDSAERRAGAAERDGIEGF